MIFGNSPLVGFYFRVFFQFQPIMNIDGSFQSVSGLKATLETEAIAEGGINRYKHQLPLRTSYQDLVLKRGMVSNLSVLTKWCALALEDYVFAPVDLTVLLMNENSMVSKGWYISHAIPVSYEIGEFNAEESKLVIESITLKYNYFTEIPV